MSEESSNLFLDALYLQIEFIKKKAQKNPKPPKDVSKRVTVFLEMSDEGKSVKDIMEHYNCSFPIVDKCLKMRNLSLKLRCKLGSDINPSDKLSIHQAIKIAAVLDHKDQEEIYSQLMKSTESNRSSILSALCKKYINAKK